MEKPDVLSYQPDYEDGLHNNENVVLSFNAVIIVINFISKSAYFILTLLYSKLQNMFKICLTSIQHQIPWLFGLICAQNSVGSLILYNGLNFTKSP